MILVERHIIKRSNPIYKQLDRVCLLSKTLYNATMYEIKQYYAQNKKSIGIYDLHNQFVKSNHPDYRALVSTKVATATMLLADKAVRSFVRLLKLKQAGKYKKPVKFPKYLHPTKGRMAAIYSNPTVSKVALRNKKLKLTGLDFEIPVRHTNIKSARIVPKNGYYVIDALYEVAEKPLKSQNGRYAAVDLGVNNLAALITNCSNKPVLINGRPLKSINQYYNKEVAKCKFLQDYQKNPDVYSGRLKRLNLKRNCKIIDYLHKKSRYLINHLVATNTNTLVIGYNQGWKQGISIGKRNNQSFMSIPFYKFCQMLQYKAQLEGINVIISNESYASKCSALDKERVCEHKKYKGKRIKRGLFRSAKGFLINADVNGALNILRKAIPKVRWMYGIEAFGMPTAVMGNSLL